MRVEWNPQTKELPMSVDEILAAAKYAVRSSRFEGDWDDMVQAACIGAIRADRTYNKEKQKGTNRTKEGWMRLCAFRSLFRHAVPDPRRPHLAYPQPERLSTRQEGPDHLGTLENRLFVEDLLANLQKKRLRLIIELRFLEGWLLQDVAVLLQISRERVRQLEENALEIMRKKVEGRGLLFE
jgi:RNA polymerase sigma factor (sigma-70 family)